MPDPKVDSHAIRPIETEYKGYRFRSRLEARWAVFFDTGGIEYQYEPEGYETEAGKYLPDFFLPELDVHVEVKGQREGYEREVLRIKDFIKWGGPIRRVVILSDIPARTDDGGLWHFPAYYFDGRSDHVKPGWFYFCDYGDNVGGNVSCANFALPPIGLMDIKSGKFSIAPMSSHGRINPRRLIATLDGDFNYRVNKNTFDALKRARQARFEHGETP